MPATGASAIRVSAVQLSAAGSGFLRLMAERPTPESLTTVAVTRHPKESNRQPLSANRYYLFFAYSGRLPHVEANFACTYGKKGLSPAEPAERVRPRGAEGGEARARGPGCSND